MTEESGREREIADLRERLAEAEETLRAIREGEVDAVVVDGVGGPKLYILRTADYVYRSLVEQMPRGAVVLDPQGDILYCNRYFADLVQTPPETVIGGPLDRFVPEAEQPAIASVRNAGHASHRGHVRSADGTLIPAYLSFTTSLIDDVDARCLIVSDLREILGAEAALAEARAEARIRDEFLAMVGHELRNPLSAIAAALAIVDAAHAPAATQAQARAVIGRQAAHLSRLVDDLLDVSRIRTGKVFLAQRTLDLATVASDVMKAFRTAGRLDRHQVTVDVEPVGVVGDATRLEQIVSNLVENALKYTPVGGRIVVRVRAEPETAALEVEDTGVGIPPHLLGKVFELFVQADHSLHYLGGAGGKRHLYLGGRAARGTR